MIVFDGEFFEEELVLLDFIHEEQIFFLQLFQLWIEIFNDSA